MPISIQYQPPAGTIAGAAATAGYGQYQKWLTELAQRQAQMNQQAALQNQEINARLFSQQQSQLANQASQVFNAERQQNLLDQQNRNLLERMRTEREWGVSDRELARTRALEDVKSGRDFTKEMSGLEFNNRWKADSAMERRREVSSIMADFGKRRNTMTDAGKIKYDNLMKDFTAITSAGSRGDITPEILTENLDKFANTLRESGLVDEINKPVNVTEDFAKNSHETPGFTWIRKPDGTYVPHERPPSSWSEYVGTKEYADLYLQIEKGMRDEYKASVAAGSKGDPPNHEAIEAKIKDMMWARFGKPEAAATDGASIPGASESEEIQKLLSALPTKDGIPIVADPNLARRLPGGTVFYTSDGRRKMIPEGVAPPPPDMRSAPPPNPY